MSRAPDRTRQVILEAALGEIHRHGFQAASLHRILAHTDVTKGALYHHFPNKKALGYAVVDEILEEMVVRDWLEPLESATDPVSVLKDRLTEVAQRLRVEDLLLGCPVNNLALEMSPVDEGFRMRVNRIYDRWREGLAAAFARGQEHGTVRKDIDPLETATFVVGAMAGCRSLAKNAQSVKLMQGCVKSLFLYWDSLRGE